jgi:hypothetical protein
VPGVAVAEIGRIGRRHARGPQSVQTAELAVGVPGTAVELLPDAS